MSEQETQDLDPNEAARAALAAGRPDPNLEDADGEDQFTEIEREAMEHGWNPEGVEGKRSLTAEEFLDRQPLYDEIGKLRKTTRKLQQGMEAMKEMHEGIRRREREAVIAELKAAKIQALENDEFDTVLAIDDEIAKEQAAAQAKPVTNEAFEDWVEENEWYHQDSELKQYADTIGAGYYQQNPNRPMTDIYKYVSKEVKARYPEKFGNVNRNRPNSVESAARGRTAASKQKHSAKELSEDERRIMKTIVRTGALTEAEYLKQYFNQKG